MDSMNENYFLHLERLIAAHTGLHLRPRDREALRVSLSVRMASLNLPDTDAYRRLLEADTPATAREWEQLTARLTNNESYFFRDRGQMALLQNRILPELIERNHGSRSLRMWSAGCSTGEEAYSLAIMTRDLLESRGSVTGKPWEIFLLGTDLDVDALQEAQRGVYTEWSFRTLEPSIQKRWFQRQADRWQILEEIRDLVTFRRCNLVTDPFPSAAPGIYEMDLILCRNVFIYFAPAAVATVLPKFRATLREGGYLMTGHAETLGQLVEPLAARQFPESVVYQRVVQTDSPAASTAKPEPVKANSAVRPVAAVRPSSDPAQGPHDPPPTPLVVAKGAEAVKSTPPTVSTEPVFEAAAARYRAGDNEGTIRLLQLFKASGGEQTLLLLAHAYANVGQAGEAAELCRRVTAISPFAAEPYELQAVLAQEQGRYDEAMQLLKQALYLAPASPMPYLELSELYEREGDPARARKMRETALNLLQQMPADRSVGFNGGPTAQDLIRHLEQGSNEGA
jgi:chemotaxis protein methyltransferase CheR